MINLTQEEEKLLSIKRTSKYNESYHLILHRGRFEKDESSAVFSQHYKNSFTRKDHLYIIVGTDSGLLPEYIKKQDLSPHSTYLFIEFDIILKEIDGEFPKNFIFITPEKWEETFREPEHLKYFYLNEVSLLQSLAVIYPHFLPINIFYSEVEKLYNILLRTCQSRFVDYHFYTTQIKNVYDNQFPITPLKNLYNDKPVVILAGGPSLDNYINWLKTNRKKYIIIAVSRIAKRLSEAQITPDFFITLDPNFSSYEVSKEIFEFQDTTVLLSMFHASPYILSQWSGLKLFIGEIFPWPSKANKETLDNFMENFRPTVTNIAIEFAQFLGSKTIVLIGLDLCFSPQGYSHALGSIERTSGPIIAYTGHKVLTNSGKIAETEDTLLWGIQALEEQAVVAKEKGCRLINPSPDAAKIENIEFTNLQSLNYSSENLNVYEDVFRLIKNKKQYSERTHYSNVVKEIKQTLYKLEKFQTLIKQGSTFNQNLFANNEPEKNYKYKIKMDKLEKQIFKHNPEIHYMIKQFAKSAFMDFAKLKNSLEEMSNTDIQKSGELYYAAYQKGIDALKKVLEEALKNGKYRLLETQNMLSKTEADKLLGHWSKLGQPGRIFTMQQNYPAQYDAISNFFPLEVQQAKLGFETSLRIPIEELNYFQETSKFASLDGIESKISSLFQQQDKAGLLKMEASLTVRNEKEAISHRYLIFTFLSILEKDYDAAITHFQSIETNLGRELILNELVRIALENKDLQSAISGMQILSEMSFLYLPELANLQVLKKDYQEALDNFTQYFEIYPDDTINLNKLGELYLKLDMTDAAKFVFERILALEPENEAANTHIATIQTKS